MAHSREVGQIETEAKAQEGGLTEVEIWLKKIEQAKDEEKKWREDAKEAVAIFEADSEHPTAFNVLHSNVETLLPALYNSTPVPDVRRRHNEGDPIAKDTVDITERLLSFSVDQYDFDAQMEAMARDGIVTGRGALRLRYEPDFEKRLDPNTQEEYEAISFEKVTTERVPWDKWGRGPGRDWTQIPFIYFEHDLTRADLVKLMGDEAKAEAVVLGNKDKDDDSGEDKGIFKTVCVYEIWDKTNKEVLFIAKDKKDGPLKREPDPFGLPAFFCMPRPIEPLHRLSSLEPICPYTVWKPLFVALDKVTKRIDSIANQLRVRGIYDSRLAADLETLRSCEDGQYVSATDATLFAQGAGGLEKAVAHWPMEPSVKALAQLEVIRERIKAFIDEVTGVADVLRGNVDSKEKLGQTQLKTQWGSLRLQKMQNDIARVARDVFRMKTEIMARKFQPQTLTQMTGMPGTPEQEQRWPQVLHLFKSDRRTFRIDIETNSTIRADMTRNQEQMNMFLAGTAQFVQGMTAGAQLAPMLLPTMVEVYSAFARNFKLGKQAEDALDKLSQMAPQMAQMAEQASQENPEAKKIEAEQKRMEMQSQADQRKAELEMQKMQLEMQIKQVDVQIKREELQIKREAMQMDLEGKRQDFALKRETAQMDIENRRQMAQMDMAGKANEQQFKQQSMEAEFANRQRTGEMEYGNKQRMAEIEMKKRQQPQNGASS